MAIPTNAPIEAFTSLSAPPSCALRSACAPPDAASAPISFAILRIALPPSLTILRKKKSRPWIAVVPSYKVSIFASRTYCSSGQSWVKPDPPNVWSDSVPSKVQDFSLPYPLTIGSKRSLSASNSASFSGLSPDACLIRISSWIDAV